MNYNPCVRGCRLITHLNEVIAKTWNYAKRSLNVKDEMMNAVLGLCGETGEVADIFKKAFYHTEKDDAEDYYGPKLTLELGDVLFYWLKVVDLSKPEGTTTDEYIDQIIAANRAKLASRHPELGQVTERFGADAIR